MSDYSMSAAERARAFPVHIELGKKGDDMPGPATVAAPKSPKTYYPTVYIEDIPGLEKLPKKGCMLVEFVRKRISVEDGPDGKPRAGVALEMRTICLPKDGGNAATLEDAFKQVGKQEDEAADYSDEEESDEEE